MDPDRRRALETAGAQLAALTAGIHLYLAVPREVRYVQAGTPFVDPRMVLFLLAGVATLVGLTLWVRGLRRDVVYVCGIALMLSYLVGWLLLAESRPGQLVAPAWSGAGHTHGSPLTTLVEHLFERWSVLVTKLTELLTLGILVVLLADERRGGEESGVTGGSDGVESTDGD